MNPWLAAVVALLPALAAPLWIALRGSLADRLVAVQLAGTMTTVIMTLMSFAFDQPSWIDLSLTLAFLALPGTLVLAIFVERWM
ncbi:MAG TPA: monovalent cation/H+ antiporter complex subunit F [Acetobacteraceae bacterium]|nr:monovalent cation/H+ antiporter complex subunit F [Acetobacteraceae bacterium]